MVQYNLSNIEQPRRRDKQKESCKNNPRYFLQDYIEQAENRQSKHKMQAEQSPEVSAEYYQKPEVSSRSELVMDR